MNGLEDRDLFLKIGSIQAQVNTCVKNDEKRDERERLLGDRVRILEDTALVFKTKVVLVCSIATIIINILAFVLSNK